MEEEQALLSHLNDLSSALLIEHIRRFTKKMCERTAIRAIADETIAGPDALEFAANGTALTLNWMHGNHHSLDSHDLLCAE
ncbi:hypothetical protein HP532_26760 [Pseudomonas sp. CrR25]|nr:hypothetical protein [Pseudomonas sp. CrR25]